MPQPDAAEWRMICAMAHAALSAAARYGSDRRSFRGYRIDAKRCGMGGEGRNLIDVTLSALCGSCVLERVLIEVAQCPHLGSACAIEPTWADRSGHASD